MMSTQTFKPKPVEKISQENMSALRLKELLASQPAQPYHLVPSIPKPPLDILDGMMEDPASEHCVVDLEVGRYDQDGFEKVQLPLTAYLSWLRDGKEGGQMQGKQVYLAQWRGLDDVSFI